MTLPKWNLAADDRGAAIIELAMIAPVLALLTIGMVDMSNAFSRKLQLEQGAHRAIEKIMQTTEDTTVEATLANEAVCQVNGTNADGTCKTSPITVANVTINYRLECVAADATFTTQLGSDPIAFDALTCPAATAKEARYIEVRVDDKYTPLFPVHFAGFNGDGTYHISATAGMRTE